MTDKSGEVFGVGPGPGRRCTCESVDDSTCPVHGTYDATDDAPRFEAGTLHRAEVKEGATETEDGARLRAFESLAASVRDAQAEVDRLEPVAILAARDLRKARDRLTDAQRQLDRQRDRLDPPAEAQTQVSVNRRTRDWWVGKPINVQTGHRQNCNSSARQMNGEPYPCDCDWAARTEALLQDQRRHRRPAAIDE